MHAAATKRVSGLVNSGLSDESCSVTELNQRKTRRSFLNGVCVCRLPRPVLRRACTSISLHATSLASPWRVYRVRVHARRDQRAPRVPPVKACSMASSSSQRDATRAPPPPDKLAALYKLVDKKAIAGVLSRYARDAELSAEAAVQAEALFGDDSLVVADLRYAECVGLAGLAAAASGAEEVALTRRSLAVLLRIIPLLLRRLEANTLLPGTIREEELDYEAHFQAAMSKAINEPVPPRAVLRERASTMGYNTLLNAIFASLNLLALPLWPAVQKRMVESFVLQGLDVIPRTAGIPAHTITGEDCVLVAIQKNISKRIYDRAFCAAVLRKWRSDAVSSVLQARGVLQTGITDYEQSNADFEDRKRVDIEKHGLRDCALLSCAKTEKTVTEFAGCSGCRSVVYCCLEHQALDWRAHKKACREAEQHAAKEA